MSIMGASHAHCTLHSTYLNTIYRRIQYRMWKTDIIKANRKYTLNRLPVENACLFEHVAQIDVGVQKIGIQCDGLLEMVDC